MDNSFALVECLVATVARAFYTDTYIIVLDALVAEKYIIEEEIGPRLKLSPKEVRKITTHLESEMLIKSENVYLSEDRRSFIKCYYIDYNVFYNVTLYRIHLMQKSIIKEEKTELHEVFYQCPTCKEQSNSLQAMRLRSKEGKFVCSHCCPADNIRELVSEAYYTLVEVDNRSKLGEVQDLEKKLQEQLNRSKDHEGIYNLLSKLNKFVPLARNKPSENISNGVRSSAVVDADVSAAIQQNLQFATGEHGSSKISAKLASSSGSRGGRVDVGTAQHMEFDISIETEDHQVGVSGNRPVATDLLDKTASQHSAFANRESNLPDFLRNSRVQGAASNIREAEAQIERTTNRSVVDESAAKRLKVEGDSTAEATAEPVDEGEDVAWEEDDDVAWEDEAE